MPLAEKEKNAQKKQIAKFLLFSSNQLCIQYDSLYGRVGIFDPAKEKVAGGAANVGDRLLDDIRFDGIEQREVIKKHDADVLIDAEAFFSFQNDKRAKGNIAAGTNNDGTFLFKQLIDA